MTDIEGLHQTIYKAVHGRVSVFLGREDFANAIWLGTEDAAKAVAALSPPEPTEEQIAHLRERLEAIAGFGSVNLNGEYEHGLRDIIRSITDCAREALRALPLQDHAVPVDQWKIVADEPVLIYVVHTNAQFEGNEKVRREKWENWTVGRWITHNHGGWMYYGMMGKVTHVAPLPAAPAMVAEDGTAPASGSRGGWLQG